MWRSKPVTSLPAVVMMPTLAAGRCIERRKSADIALPGKHEKLKWK
jgi:hypothetical protein